jgi:hypothetical protein
VAGFATFFFNGWLAPAQPDPSIYLAANTALPPSSTSAQAHLQEMIEKLEETNRQFGTIREAAQAKPLTGIRERACFLAVEAQHAIAAYKRTLVLSVPYAQMKHPSRSAGPVLKRPRLTSPTGSVVVELRGDVWTP